MAGQGKWVMARGCCCPRPPNAEDAACICSSFRINSICISICISICMNCICINICMNCICSTIWIICICITCIHIHFCIFLSYRRLQPRAWDASWKAKQLLIGFAKKTNRSGKVHSYWQVLPKEKVGFTKRKWKAQIFIWCLKWYSFHNICRLKKRELWFLVGDIVGNHKTTDI